MQPYRLGGIEISRVVETEDPFLPLLEIFPEARPEDVEANRHWLEPRALTPEGVIIIPVQSYIVRTSRHLIVIDTCVGNHKSYDGMPGWKDRRQTTWMDNLRASGMAPEEVDYVFCSHLHVDHCGWNTSFVDGRWVPTFANAKYVFSRPEYESSERSGSSVFQENVQPIMEAGQGVLVDMDYALDDEVWLEPTPGHTKGHVAVNLASQGQRGAMCGDLIHSPIQCLHPEWSPKFDRDPEQARQTRRKFLESHADNGDLVMTAHFPTPSMGHVVSRDQAFWFDYVA